jgi:drug/metabolite transporter (DMT)-like permease
LNKRDAIDLVLLAALWGASFLFIRIAAPQFGAFPLMALRTGIGTLVLLPFLLRERRAVAALHSHAGRIAGMGLLNSALPFVMFGYAMQYLNAGFTSILNATTPFWGAVVAYVWLGERLGAMRVFGLVVGFGGVLVLVWGRVSFAEGGFGLPILATLVATLSYAVAATATKKHLGDLSALTGAAGSLLAATLMLLPFAIARWPAQPPDLRAWASVALLGVLCTGLAYLLFFRLIARIGSTRSVTVTFLIPVFAMLWGALFLGESVSARMLAGAATILAGTLLTTGLLVSWRRSPVVHRDADASTGPPSG